MSLKTRILTGGVTAALMLTLTTTALASSHRDAPLGWADLVETLRGIDGTALSRSQGKNLGKSLDGLVRAFVPTDDSLGGSWTDRVYLKSLQEAAGHLARAVGGTPDEEVVANAIIGILIALRTNLEGIADELETRWSSGDFNADGLRSGSRPMVMAKKGRKVRRLLDKARSLIDQGGGGIFNDGTLTLSDKGKDLKRRLKRLRKAGDKLRRIGTMLTKAGR